MKMISHDDAPVHFVWVGDLATKNKQICCGLGPKSLATITNKKIFMWVNEELMDEAKGIFKDNSNIEVLSIEQMLENRYNAELKIVTSCPDVNFNEIKKIYYSLKKAGIYIAQKDLVSFIIMAEYGGYFFDTTTRFVEEPDLPPLKKLTMDNCLDCNFKILLAYNNITDLKNHDVIHPFASSDVWTFASESNTSTEMFENIFLFSLFRCQEIWNVHKAGEATGPMFVPAFITALEAVYGLHVDDISPNLIKNVALTKQNSGCGWFVPELKMEKFHVGAWRHYSKAKEFLDRQGDVYIELGLDFPPKVHLVKELLDMKKLYIKDEQGEIIDNQPIEEALSNLIKRLDGEKIILSNTLSIYMSSPIREIIEKFLSHSKEIIGVAVNSIEDFFKILDVTVTPHQLLKDERYENKKADITISLHQEKNKHISEPSLQESFFSKEQQVIILPSNNTSINNLVFSKDKNEKYNQQINLSPPVSHKQQIQDWKEKAIYELKRATKNTKSDSKEAWLRGLLELFDKPGSNTEAMYQALVTALEDNQSPLHKHSNLLASVFKKSDTWDIVNRLVNSYPNKSILSEQPISLINKPPEKK